MQIGDARTGRRFRPRGRSARSSPQLLWPGNVGHPVVARVVIEIWIEEAGQEIYRQTLPEGRYHLGRANDNEIAIANPGLSRRHLLLDVRRDQLLVTDLGSTNGSRLNGRGLTPHQAFAWPEDEVLRIGPLKAYVRRQPPSGPQQEPAAQADRAFGGPTSGRPYSPAESANIICNEAVPQATTLGDQPVYVGTHPTCAIRLLVSDAASHHCLVQLSGGQISVTNLDPNRPAQIDGQPLPVGQPVTWQQGHPLQVGGATLFLSFGMALDQAAGRGAYGGSTRSRGWRSSLPLPLALAAIGGVLVVCLAAALIVGASRSSCDGFDLPCLIGSLLGDSDTAGTPAAGGRATPTLAPFSTNPPVTATPQTITFATPEAQATNAPVDCQAQVTEVQGWLDLPFPYQGVDPVFGGTAELFRRISQRSRFGGRLNSFFDHEYPVYPPIFGGYEGPDVTTTLVTFNGERTPDAYSQDVDGADWYSGHAGIDFAPAVPREASTPVLAAAGGRLRLAVIDNDGNHMVQLEHDPDGDGQYQYETLYFHLNPDDFFFAMTELEQGTPIEAGQRIGTMGTTGRSTGIHLHFELRQDLNGDGDFTSFERIDPYGYFPSTSIPDDPWAKLATFIINGREVDHAGVVSDYMWVHPLVELFDTAGACDRLADIGVQVDIYPVHGFAVINPGFTYVARDNQGNVLREGTPHVRSLTILPESLDGVDFNSISLEFLDPVLDTWRTVSEGKSIEPNVNGGYIFRATISKTGRYVLVAKETVDRVPPVTRILLDGERVEGQTNTFVDSVSVSLLAQDRAGGEVITSGIRSVQYSLDCGLNWRDYDGPFEVTLGTSHACGESGSGLQGIELSSNDFLLLAQSEDSENNIEQPAAQARFTIAQ